MNHSYRNQTNAEYLAKYWNKPLDRPDWYKFESLADDAAELIIYDVIGWPYTDIGDLVRTMASLKNKHILARLNSPGGDVWDGMALYNAFKNHPGGVTTRGEGLVASIASIIYLAGKKREAYQNTMFMVHEPWTGAIGNQYDFNEIIGVLSQISGNMSDIYSDNTKMGKREAKEMMKTGVYLNSASAKEKGFVLSILDGNGAKAEFDLSMYAYLKSCEEIKNEENKDFTIRDAERALRDAGCPKNKAKAMLAGRLPVDAVGINEIAAQLKQITNLMKG